MQTLPCNSPRPKPVPGGFPKERLELRITNIEILNDHDALIKGYVADGDVYAGDTLVHFGEGVFHDVVCKDIRVLESFYNVPIVQGSAHRHQFAAFLVSCPNGCGALYYGEVLTQKGHEDWMRRKKKRAVDLDGSSKREDEASASQIEFPSEQLARDAKLHLEREYKRLISRIITNVDHLIASLSPYQFEDLVTWLFRKIGYKAHKTRASNDGGKDIIISDGSGSVYVECKQFKRGLKVGRPHVQKLAGAIAAAGAVKGIFVTTSSFNENAIECARACNIELIDGEQLVRLLSQYCDCKDSDTSYTALCLKCGEQVRFDLCDYVDSAMCRKRHWVERPLINDYEDFRKLLPSEAQLQHDSLERTLVPHDRRVVGMEG